MNYSSEVPGHWRKALCPLGFADEVYFSFCEINDVFFLSFSVVVDVEDDVEFFFTLSFGPAEYF